MTSDTPDFRRAARAAGIAYLVVMTATISELMVRPMLVVAGDPARTAANILAHAQLFRVGIVFDLVTCIGVLVLNVALYELLAPVGRGLARFAALCRTVEVAIYGAVTVNKLIVVSLLNAAIYRRALEPHELHGLARLFLGAQQNGFFIAVLFCCIGATTWMYLLVRSRYVPMALARLGVAVYVLGIFYAAARVLYPVQVAAATAGALKLPPAVLALLALLFLPVIAFEIILGLWLLIKGVRVAPVSQN